MVPQRSRATNPRSSWPAAALLVLCVSIACSQSPKPEFRDIQDKIRSTTETVALAQVDTLTLTNQLLRTWLEVAKPTKYENLPIPQIMALPGPELADSISNLCFYAMAESDALKQADFVSTGMVRALAEQRERLLHAQFIEKEITAKNPPLNDEQARRWYQEHIFQYTQPFNFTCRAIWLSGDRPYRLRRGDTMQSIAREQLGDPLAINRILDSTTSQPLFTPLDPKAVSDFFAVAPSGGFAPSLELLRFLPPRPPREGQQLWIPMKPEERQQVRQRIEKIEAELKAGGDFEALAKAKSEDAPTSRGRLMGPLPVPGRPILQSVIDAAVKTPVGQVTPILETPHGFMILKIYGKTEQPVEPYEQVKDQMIREELDNRRTRAAGELVLSLFRDPIFRVDREAIMNDNGPDMQVIVRVGDYKYTWGDFRRDTGRRYSWPRTYEGRVSLLTDPERHSPYLRTMLIQTKAHQLGLDRAPQVASQIRTFEMAFRGRAYLEWYATRKIAVDEAALRQLYLGQRDRFREAGEYALREIVVKLEPEDTSDTKKIDNVMNYLREDVLKQARSERAFVRFAESVGNWPVRDRGAIRDVAENYRGPEFAKVLSTLEPGKCEGPFRIGDEIFLVRIQSRSPVRYRTFEEVKPQLEELHRQQHSAELMAAAEKEIRARHRFELLFRYESKGQADSGGKEPAKRSP